MTAAAVRPVFGLDLSLTSTGLAAARPDGTIETYRVRSTGTKNASVAARAERLADITVAIAEWMGGPGLVVVEGPSFGQMRQGGEHIRAGLWWTVAGALITSGCSIVEASPATLKTFATGKGNAGKDEVFAAVIRRYPDVDITGNDVADAVALCTIGCHLDGRPIVKLPGTHTRALLKLSLPAEAAA